MCLKSADLKYFQFVFMAILKSLPSKIDAYHRSVHCGIKVVIIFRTFAAFFVILINCAITCDE